ncbi:MAG: ABC transporter permease, partial [bacterium]|nr:ABC transporter permease [bacterium]
MLFWSMAWRNVWRHRRRSLLTVATISLGLTFNIFMRGVGDGFHEQMVDNSVQAHIGHIQIHRAGYHDDPGLQKTLPSVEQMRAAIGQLPELRGASLRVLGDGLASTAMNSAGVAIVGVDPEEERKVTNIHRAVVEGEYLSPGANNRVLIGERLSKVLQIGLDENLVLLVQAADGSMGAEKYRISGIFRSGSPEIDRGIVYLLREDAQYLFSLDGRITEAALLLDSSHQVDEYTATLAGALDGGNFEVLPWYTVEPYIQQFIELDDAFFYIIVLILFIVISVGILNTILMSVFERVREFGVMMSLGMRPRQVVALVVQEAALLASVGIILG